MSWELRSVARTYLVDHDGPESCVMISGRLHHNCFCAQCTALEATAGNVAELLAPGEGREIGIEGSPLYLVIKRHQFPPSTGRVKCHRVTAVDERLKAITGRGRDFTLLRR
jgi:hypothetical protein